MIKKDIIYTPEAEKRLEKAKSDFVEKLEGAVKSRKYYPGDEVLEITASDIEIAIQNYSFRRPSSTSLKINILITYIVMGAFMALFGLFYDQFMNLFRDNPIRLVFVLGGIITSVASMLLYMKIKQENQNKLAKEIALIEEMRYPESQREKIRDNLDRKIRDIQTRIHIETNDLTASEIDGDGPYPGDEESFKQRSIRLKELNRELADTQKELDMYDNKFDASL